MDRCTFPADLIDAQREWHAVYRALAAPRPRPATELRRRLLLLSVRIEWARGELRRMTAGDRRAEAA
ncbi:hypothetical protein [Streptomyces rubiginosohelvolus]